jgi:WD40 repeat protein
VLRVFTGHGELINGGSVTTVAGRRVLATVSRDRSARLYDLDTGELLNVLSGHDESVKAVAWHPGGDPLLLTGSYDFTGRLWTLDPQTWQVTSIASLIGHDNAISAVSWFDGSPVTGSWDGTVRLWRHDDAEVPTARELAVPGLRSATQDGHA